MKIGYCVQRLGNYEFRNILASWLENKTQDYNQLLSKLSLKI